MPEVFTQFEGRLRVSFNEITATYRAHYVGVREALSQSTEGTITGVASSEDLAVIDLNENVKKANIEGRLIIRDEPPFPG